MFNLFNKTPVLIKHQYKNLSIELPSNWVFKFEEGDMEACFDPKSQSTLRLHIIEAVASANRDAEEELKSLAGTILIAQRLRDIY